MSTEGIKPEAPTDPFMKAAQGRYPLSTNPGAARYWAFEVKPDKSIEYDGIPRPDRSASTLKLLSTIPITGLLGIDHFYLRSPVTGIAKLLTLGGFGLWYLWDALQTTLEDERVATYGMSLPFDYKTGIGQGMITTGDTYYTQSSNFSLWSLATMLGLEGFMMGKYAQGIRHVVDLVHFLALVFAMMKGGHSIISYIFYIISIMIFGSFALIPWWNTVSNTALNPSRMFNKGIQVDEKTDKFLNYFKSWTKGFGKTVHEKVMSDFGYGNIAPDEFKEKFAINHEDPAGPPPTSGKEEGAPEEKNTWIASLLMGNIVSGPIIALASYFPWIELAVRGAFTESMAAAMEEEVAERAAAVMPPIPGIPGVATGLAGGLPKIPGGLTNVAAGLTGGLPKIPTAEELKALAATKATEAIAAKIQTGGARRTPSSELSIEGIVLGATTLALVGGGALKMLIDSLVKD